MSLESTAWYPPSCSSTRSPTTGKPMYSPRSRHCRNPFSIAPMNSSGTFPPFTLLSKTKSPPSSLGVMTPEIFPYWPDPPVCFLCT